jgi:hypothetical protein
MSSDVAHIHVYMQQFMHREQQLQRWRLQNTHTHTHTHTHTQTPTTPTPLTTTKTKTKTREIKKGMKERLKIKRRASESQSYSIHKLPFVVFLPQIIAFTDQYLYLWDPVCSRKVPKKIFGILSGRNGLTSSHKGTEKGGRFYVTKG